MVWAMSISALRGTGRSRRNRSSRSGRTPWVAATRIMPPSTMKTTHPRAPQTLTPLWAIVSKTGWTSVGELPITRRISLIPASRFNAPLTSACASVSVILLLHLLEQARILDGDHSLIGKRGDELDLLGRKRLRRRSCDGDSTDAASLSEQRDAYQCTIATEWLGTVTVFRIGEHIRNVYNPALQCDTAGHGISAGRNRMLPCVFFQLRWVAMTRRN